MSPSARRTCRACCSRISRPFRSRLSSRSRFAWYPTDGDEILKGIDWAGAPPLLGYDVTSLKPTASARPAQRQPEPTNRSDLCGLALRAGPFGRVHVGRPGALGGGVAGLARLRQVLGAGRALDAPALCAERVQHTGDDGGQPGPHRGGCHRSDRGITSIACRCAP